MKVLAVENAELSKLSSLTPAAGQSAALNVSDAAVNYAFPRIHSTSPKSSPNMRNDAGHRQSNVLLL